MLSSGCILHRQNKWKEDFTWDSQLHKQTCNVTCKNMWEEHNVNPQGNRKCMKRFCYWWQEKKQHIGLRGKQMF